MTGPGPPGPIAVYGATGYTGKLIVAELCRRGVEDVVLSGQRGDALRAVAADHGYGVGVRAAAHDDPAAVEGALRMVADGYDRSRGLAPAEAYEARSFLDALAEHGVTYQAPVPSASPV